MTIATGRAGIQAYRAAALDAAIAAGLKARTIPVL
jgi:hypothetical protein